MAYRSILRLMHAALEGGATMVVRPDETGGANILDMWPDRALVGQVIPAGTFSIERGSTDYRLDKLPSILILACGSRPGSMVLQHLNSGDLLLVLSPSQEEPDDELVRAALLALNGVEEAGQKPEDLKRTDRRLQSLVRTLPVPFVFVEASAQHVMVNPSARSLLKLRPDGLASADVTAALTAYVEDRADEGFRRTMGLNPQASASFSTTDARGTFKVETCWIDDADFCGRVWTFSDISEERRLENQLRQLAMMDHLTGALNRRAFDLSLKSETERAHRYRLPLSLIVLDLDHFKAINDTHGHDGGDLVLQEAASRIRNTLREGDLFARIGGEELAVLLPHTSRDNAVDIAARILSLLRDTPVTRSSKAPIRITASAGVAGLRTHEKAVQMVSRADQALYRAKASGRDKVIAEDL